MAEAKSNTNQPIQVEILGQHYTIAGEGNEAYVKELARYVDAKIRELAKHTNNIPTPQLALLAAINITHELFKGREDQKNRELLLGKKHQDLINTIDQEFGDIMKTKGQPKQKEAFLGKKHQDLIDTIDQEFRDLKMY